MTLHVLNTKSDKRYLNKTTKEITTKDCRLKEGTSIINPVVQIKKMTDKHVRMFNYAYIEEFQRYYFVENIVELPANILEVTMHVDVLQTYVSDINGITTLILRQENIYNPYFVDEELLVRCTRFRTKKNIGTVGNDGVNYYLTVNNGGI